MTATELDALFRPRSVAIVGASSHPGKVGAAVMRSLSSFEGCLYPIHRTAETIGERPAFPTVESVGKAIDLAILAIPAEAVPSALEDCVSAGVRSAIVCAGGFGETPGGQLLQDKVLEIVSGSSLRLLGPNTSGYVNPVDSVISTFASAAGGIAAGSAAIVSASGGASLATAFHATREGLGIRLSVGLGNAVDVEMWEVVRFLANDPATDVIGLQIEGVGSGVELCEAIADASSVKPVVVYKVGRSDIGEFAKSHTGAMLGDYRLSTAALRQSGAVLAGSIEELVDSMRALQSGRAQPRQRAGIGVVTGQAGPGMIIADTIQSAGGNLPALTADSERRLSELLPPLTWMGNPVDTGRPGESFSSILGAVASDESVDVLAIYAVEEPAALDPVCAISDSGARDDVPVLFGTAGPGFDNGARELRDLAPSYCTPERLARAAVAVAADAEAQWLNAAIRNELSSHSVSELRLSAGPDEHEAKSILEQLGIKCPRRIVCTDHSEARRALSELRTPVAVKVLSSDIAHKSDVGGVHLNIVDQETLDQALKAIDAIPGNSNRYLLEEQAPRGTELIVGGIRDATFGPCVAIGLGGVFVELGQPPAVGRAPVGETLARRLVNEIPEAVLKGFRGAPPVPVNEVAKVVTAVSDLLTSSPSIREIEINPLAVTRDGLLALDALISVEVCHD